MKTKASKIEKQELKINKEKKGGSESMGMKKVISTDWLKSSEWCMTSSVLHHCPKHKTHRHINSESERRREAEKQNTYKITECNVLQECFRSLIYSDINKTLAPQFYDVQRQIYPSEGWQRPIYFLFGLNLKRRPIGFFFF